MQSRFVVPVLALMGLTQLGFAADPSDLAKKIGFKADSATAKGPQETGTIGKTKVLHVKMPAANGQAAFEIFSLWTDKAKTRAEAEKACAALAPAGTWRLPGSMAEMTLVPNVLPALMSGRPILLWIDAEKFKVSATEMKLPVDKLNIQHESLVTLSASQGRPALSFLTYDQVVASHQAIVDGLVSRGVLGAAYAQLNELLAERANIVGAQEKMKKAISDQLTAWGFDEKTAENKTKYAAKKAEIEDQYSDEIDEMKKALAKVDAEIPGLRDATADEIKKIQPEFNKMKMALNAALTDVKAGTATACIIGDLPKDVGTAPKHLN